MIKTRKDKKNCWAKEQEVVIVSVHFTQKFLGTIWLDVKLLHNRAYLFNVDPNKDLVATDGFGEIERAMFRVMK